ncbi:hypothetical protein AC1031_002785 [Aphanomyces cochlioides]|nr:hypothetical protein AC1031_002785 [Aphanomyces cochlioides]
MLGHNEDETFVAFPVPRSGPSTKRWPATIYDYSKNCIADDRISALDVDTGQWVHCRLCDCQLRCDNRNLFSNERWNRHLRRNKKHNDIADGPAQNSHDNMVETGQLPKKKRKKLTQVEVDWEFQSQLDVEPSVIAQQSVCPGALPAESFEMLQIFARFGQIPPGAQVVRGAGGLGFQLFSTLCTKRLVSRRKNQPDCCEPCFALFVDANLKKRIFQNMKTYARVLAVLESPTLPENGLIDLQNFLKIPVRNMNHAGKQLRLHVENFVEFHKAKKEPCKQKHSKGSSENFGQVPSAQAKSQDQELKSARPQDDLMKINLAAADSHNLLVL